MFIPSMLCGLKKADSVVNDPNWCWEKKMDGERAEIEFTGGKRFIYARSGREKNRMYPDLMVQVQMDCILDGEIEAATGKFNDIQRRANRENGIAEAAKLYPVRYNVFDVLSIKGVPTLGETLQKRKDWLAKLVIPTPTCIVVPFYTDGHALYQDAVANGYEGIVGKKLASRYQPNGRGEDWIKVKILKRMKLWVVGYTPGTGWRQSTFGSMVIAKVGAVEPFIPVGEVGTGFDQQELERLNNRMKTQPAGIPMFKYPDPITWLSVPFEIVCEYLELTNDGKLRFPSYKGTV